MKEILSIPQKYVVTFPVGSQKHYKIVKMILSNFHECNNIPFNARNK